MCLMIEQKGKPKARIAGKRGKIVYKILKDSEGIYFSPYQNCRYFPNEIKKVHEIGEVSKLDVKNIWYILHGLHAYTKKKEADKFCTFGRVIVKMLIPPGSKYYLGMDNEIVTTKLKWLEVVCTYGD